MYETFFEFTGRPFAAVPCVDQYFPAAAIEAARESVGRCLERGDGTALVVGPSGTGKTLLCHVLARQLADSYQVVLLGAGHLGTKRALLQAILFELRQPYRDMDDGELRLALFDYLGDEQRCPEDMVLLVDEAHTLSLRLLEELRMVTNQIHAARPRVRLALVGGPSLEERLANPRLDSLSQRTVVRGYVQAMEGCETDQYISAQIEAVGGTADALFPVEARRRVHRATDGIPRLVNQVCDHALLLACADGRRQITADGIEEAWADLQQLPTPWNGEADHADQSAEGVVEFGGLDDEPVDIGGTEPTETTPVGEDFDEMPVDEMPVDEMPVDEMPVD
ncbi:MAG: AAA family ATPase, partial [Planctomycetes bacterium]|nr:AAA family ATPase [Planctomycetota bacterium]